MVTRRLDIFITVEENREAAEQFAQYNMVHGTLAYLINERNMLKYGLWFNIGSIIRANESHDYRRGQDILSHI